MFDIGTKMGPLEEMIRHEYTPALLERTVTDTERAMLSLSARLGGSHWKTQ